MKMTETDFTSQFNETLDELNPVVIVCGLPFDASEILKKCDPAAYRQTMLDYADTLDIELI